MARSEGGTGHFASTTLHTAAADEPLQAVRAELVAALHEHASEASKEQPCIHGPGPIWAHWPLLRNNLDPLAGHLIAIWQIS